MPIRYQYRSKYADYSISGVTNSFSGSSSTGARSPAQQRLRTTDIDELEAIQYNVVLGAGGITTFDFFDDNILANQNEHQMDSGSGFPISQVVPYRGSIIAMGISGTAAKSAGTLTFTLYVDGVATGAVATLPNVQYYSAKFTKGTYGWAAGSRIDVRLSTDGSYSPVTNDYEVVVYTTLEQSEVQ